MEGGLTRARLLTAAGAALGALAIGPNALASALRAPVARKLSVANVGRRFVGDTLRLATVAPGVTGRDAATVRFDLSRAATARLEAVRTGLGSQTVVWESETRLGAGPHEMTWTPSQSTPVGSYVMRLTLEDGELRRIYGGRRPATPERATSAVVRVVGVEAAFSRRSYLPGERMQLRVLADAGSLELTFLRIGHGPDPSLRTDEVTGVPMGEPVRLDWAGKRSGRVTASVQTGDWPTGLYAARLQTEDGRLGFAPFVLRPRVPGGASRVAAILPTNTWQAYNFHDLDGDGWGDTWYAGGSPPVLLDRAYRDRGVPPRFRRYDFPFLRWLEKTGRTADILADDDLEAFADGDALRRTYDVVIFPGHSEYMTEHAFDVVERFRDLGGRLAFLSANNFFWKVEKTGNTMRRIKLWRSLGRPESRLGGVQYRANDNGKRQGVFYVTDPAAAPWLFAGTGLVDGETFGTEVGGFGIEIDMTTRDSPAGTRVIAVIPSLFGPGLNAEMSYYETTAGARVFSAGVLDFPAFLLQPLGMQMLDNLWRHLLADVPPG